ncbi:MAG: hypothetical protein Q9198_009706, partial [Flavoplaca austrocitrina]
EGAQSLDELKTIYKDRIQKQREKATTKTPFTQPPPPPAPTSIPTSSQPAPPKTSTPPGLKTLSSYLDLPKTLVLPRKEIEYIWRLRHAHSPTSLCAILESDTYLRIQNTARKHPHFILPLPREGSTGAEIHFLQWSFPAPDTATRRVQPAAYDYYDAFGVDAGEGCGVDAGAGGGWEGS